MVISRKYKRSSSAGVTLLEMMFVVALLTVVAGTLFGMAVGIGDTSQATGMRATTSDEARKGMLRITQQLRQGAMSTFSALPASTLTFRRAADLDGNGSAVDVGIKLELTTPITLQRDTADANSDGLRDTQLVMIQDGNADVLANNLLPDEDLNSNGTLEAGEDLNGNGILDRGLWFRRDNNCVTVTIQARGELRNERALVFSLVETVYPRN
jgi:hypothetical protein